MKGIFGNLFDLNRDGKIRPVERAMELHMLNEMINQDQKKQDTFDDWDEFEDEDEMTELETAGFFFDKTSWMCDYTF